MEERSAQLEALAIRIRDTAGFAGDAPMRALRHAEDGDPQYAGADLSAVAVLPVRAEIAADRPEIYAVAGTTTQQADRLGYQPAALALSLALRRANALAAELGVATQWISLAAEYPSAVISNFSTVRAAGIALTPQGTLDAAWQRLVPAPAPSVSLPATSAPQPSPTPAPFASREPFSVTHYDAAPYAIPIELSDWQSRLVVEADRAVPVIADRFRLSIAVGNADVQQRRALPSPASVKRALSAEAFVEDVAVQASGEGLPVGYQILVKVGSNSISRVVDRVRSAYGSSGVTYKFDVKAELEDCEAPLERAQQLSLDEALHSAIAQARDENKLLRHLVVAAAYPPSLGDGETCEPHARPESLNIPTQPVLEIPSLKLTAHAPIELAFRTGSPPTAVAAALPRP